VLNWIRVGRLLLQALACMRYGNATNCIVTIGEAFEMAQQLQQAGIAPRRDDVPQVAEIDENERYFWDDPRQLSLMEDFRC